ncbi:MAG: respiratory nitrate reductase subunit gamma [Desulfococcaceae bacterium]|jgi:nitrate reductase gamma subunit|nr:respiratory nitrate reductase subunit gamma [Desulfococcaceae bacterium]
MHSIYNFVSGPMVWVAFIVFIGGCLYRLLSMGILAAKRDNVVFSYASPYYGMRSVLRWLTPFATTNMRKHPGMTVVTFIFHFCLLLSPLFVYGHIALISESWNVSWWYLPDSVGDVMAFLVVGACAFFMIRRLKDPEVKYLTSASDFVILAIVAAPFLTGFWTYHQWPGYRIGGILHILSGEIMLMAIPFTRLSHMIFFPFTRGYIGSEFGAVRHVQDW